MPTTINQAFSYLLEVYKLRSTVISDALFVNKTLVSKWKNGKRKILAEYAEKLADFFIAHDKEYGFNYLSDLLKNAYPGRVVTGKNKKPLLAEWLCESSGKPHTISGSADTTQTYQTFFGRLGLMRAIRHLAAAAKSSLPGGAFFYCLNASHVEFFAQRGFERMWYEVIDDLYFNHGIRMRLVNMMDWRVEELQNIADTILYWDLSGEIDGVFYTGKATLGDSFVILVPGFAVLRISYDEKADDKIFATMFFDKFMLEQQQRLCENLYSSGPRLCAYDVFNNNTDLPLVHGTSVRFVSSVQFPVFPANIGLLKEYCGVSDVEAEVALKKYPILFTAPENIETRYILSAKGLTDALKNDFDVGEILSAVFKRKIILPRAFLVVSVKALKTAAQNNSAKLLILNESDFFPQFNIILDETSAFGYCPGHNGFYKNQHLIDFMHSYYTEAWDRLCCAHPSDKAVKFLEKLISEK